MTELGKIRVGALKTYIEIVVSDTNTSDINYILDVSSATVKTLTIQDPDGNNLGPFTLSFVTNGTDGRLFLYTDAVTSIWTKGGMWKWWANITLSSGVLVLTSIVIREVVPSE